MSVAWQGWPVPGTIVSSSSDGQMDWQRRLSLAVLSGTWPGRRYRRATRRGNATGKKQVGGLTGVFTWGSGTGLTTSWASGQADGDDLVGGPSDSAMAR